MPKEKKYTTYRHFFFDLDGTITRSRSPIEDSMRKTLATIMRRGGNVVIVSGARVAQGQAQTKNLPCFYLGQNGNHAFDGKTLNDIWKRELSPQQKKEVFSHIKAIPRDWQVIDETDLIEDRGSQVSYSLLGHHEEVAKKEAFDPDFKKRRALLEEYPFESKTVEVKIGGTTCLDYFERGKNKGYNVTELIRLMNWEKDECIYLGDALFPGGNDETVIGIIETMPVKNPTETINFLKKQLY